MQNIEDVPYSTCVHESDVSSNIHIHTCINNNTKSHTLLGYIICPHTVNTGTKA